MRSGTYTNLKIRTNADVPFLIYAVMGSSGLLTTNLIRMKKYKIIYADPAWKYNDKQNTPKLGGAVKHYQTMTIK